MRALFGDTGPEVDREGNLTDVARCQGIVCARHFTAFLVTAQVIEAHRAIHGHHVVGVVSEVEEGRPVVTHTFITFSRNVLGVFLIQEGYLCWVLYVRSAAR